MAEKKPIEVDYCKEAMDANLKTLPPRDIEIIIANIAKVLNGELNDINIVLNKVDEKTNKVNKIKIPVKSFLRCDIIRDGLKKLGITNAKINRYLGVEETPVKPRVETKVENIPTKPASDNEVKRFIYQALKEKYGDFVISKKYDKDIVVQTKIDNVCIKLDHSN